jgi:hypothetical protein
VSGNGKNIRVIPLAIVVKWFVVACAIFSTPSVEFVVMVA